RAAGRLPCLLLKRDSEVTTARVHLVKQTHVFNRYHCLIGKGGNEIDLLLCEWVDCWPGQKENTDRSSLPQERNGKPSANPPALLRLEHGEFRIGQNVGNMNNCAFEHSSATDRSTIDLRRKIPHELTIIRRETGERGELKTIAIHARDIGSVCPAKSRGRLGQRVKNRLQIKS